MKKRDKQNYNNVNNLNTNRPNKRRNKKNSILVPILIVLLVFLCLAGFGLYYTYSKISANKEYIQFNEYFEDNSQFVSVEDEYVQTTHKVAKLDDNFYITTDTANKYVSDRIFYDKDLDRVLIVTPDDYYSISTNGAEYTLNGKERALPIKTLKEDGTVYLPIELLNSFFNFDIKYDEESGMLSINDLSNDSSYAEIKRDTGAHYKADKDAPVTQKMEKGTKVEVFNEYGKYTKIKTDKGILGYVDTKTLKNITVTEGVDKSTKYTKNLYDKPIMLLWDQVTNLGASTSSDRKKTPDYVNVLSPTWFEFESSYDGSIKSIASTEYTNLAHDNGIKVWGLLSDNFDSEVSNAILTNSSARQKAVVEVVAKSKELNLDGINIDFEAVRSDDAIYFTQFIRELYYECRKNDLVLSVDTFTPSAWSMYYNRAALAESSDYVAIMAYDEHTSASETIGPVASLTFVEEGIKATLNEVPKEQILLGLPLYTRIWTTASDGSFTLKNVSMDSALQTFKDNNATFTEDGATGYTHAQYTEGSKTYDAWLESNETLLKKMELYNEYDLAGVAMWKRFLENDDTFKIINAKMAVTE